MGWGGCAVGMFLAVALAGPAQAAVVGVRTQYDYRTGAASHHVEFTAEAGETNRLRISQDARALRFLDEGAEIFAGSGCTQVGPREATCPLHSLTVALDDMDDVVSAGAVAAISTGDGDDHATVSGGTVHGGAGADIVEGSARLEVLTGGPGADKLSGGDGDDQFEDSADGVPDIFSGGPGADRVYYTVLDGELTLDLPGKSAKGPANENDELISIEHAIGSAPGVRLVGDDGDNHLTAFADSPPWEPNWSSVVGGAGDDDIGVPNEFSPDAVDAGPGDDTIFFDGVLEEDTPRDELRCGSGRDTVGYPNPLTLVPDDCERVESVNDIDYKLNLPARSLRQELVRVSSYLCGRRAPCGRLAGKIRLADRRGNPAGPVLARDADSGVPRLSLRLNRDGRRLLRRRRQLRVTVLTRDAGGRGRDWFVTQLRYRP